MRASLLLGLSVCIASACAPAVAQDASSTGEVHTRIQGIEIPATPDAPFLARIVVTLDQPQAGGGVLSRKYYTMVARDSKGRVHRETRGFVPADSSAEPPLERVTILDPVSGRRTVCQQTAMTCTRSAFRPRPIIGNDMAAGGDGQSANLGTRTMEGLTVQGTRKTTPAYDGSSSIETETWFSPDLGIDLLVVRRSPQMGTVTLSVKELQRGEPDASWFSTPSGFQMVKTSRR